MLEGGVEDVGVQCIITADFYQIDGYDISSGPVRC